MNIIEKLGITPIEDFLSGTDTSGEFVCSKDEVRDLEIQRNEMLEALIEIATDKSFFNIPGEAQKRVDIARKVLEKATGKSWGQIKGLLNEL